MSTKEMIRIMLVAIGFVILLGIIITIGISIAL